MGKRLEIIKGQTIQNFIVIKEIEKGKYGRKLELKCKCGNIVEKYLNQITSGNTKSCGCLKSKVAIERNTSHGKSNTRIYSIWCGMKKRCYNNKSTFFKDYGGRGIILCSSWLDFNYFYKWAMQYGYNDTLSIDRKDNNKNYEPSNCRWVGDKIQSRNKRNNVFIEINGEKLCVSDAAKVIGITRKALSYRLKNWDLKKALTTPNQKKV